VDAALSRITLSLPNLLILDGRLPGMMSGWQYTVLMLTAAAETGTAYLTKPFNIDVLLATICGVMQTWEQQAVAV
jgi:DNA-binding response OmpR family regulator